MAEESYYGMQEIADSIGASRPRLVRAYAAIEKAGEEIRTAVAKALAEAIEAYPRPVSDD